MVFLDYASTNPVVKYPQRLYRDVLGEGYFFNPNANYAYKEKRLLAEAENRVKKAIGAKGGKVVFGGTSSQLIENLFTHIAEETNEYLTICSVYEHDAMWRFADQWGKVDSLKHVIQTYNGDKQLLVSLMGVNNLTGEIFPVKDIGRLCHEYNAFCICDATALLGHAVIEPNIDDWCDLLVLDGHKLGTELGIGCCWVSDRLDKWLNGFKLHGTPNLAGACAMADAVTDACDKYKLGEKIIHYGELQNCLIDYLVRNRIDFQLVPDDNTYPSGHEFTFAINAIRLPGTQAEALQQYLASKDIYIGVGHSSCSNDTRVLESYGLTKGEAHETIRISFNDNSSIKDVKALAEGIKEFQKTYC